MFIEGEFLQTLRTGKLLSWLLCMQIRREVNIGGVRVHYLGPTTLESTTVVIALATMNIRSTSYMGTKVFYNFVTSFTIQHPLWIEQTLLQPRAISLYWGSEFHKFSSGACTLPVYCGPSQLRSPSHLLNKCQQLEPEPHISHRHFRWESLSQPPYIIRYTHVRILCGLACSLHAGMPWRSGWARRNRIRIKIQAKCSWTFKYLRCDVRSVGYYFPVMVTTTARESGYAPSSLLNSTKNCCGYCTQIFASRYLPQIEPPFVLAAWASRPIRIWTSLSSFCVTFWKHRLMAPVFPRNVEGKCSTKRIIWNIRGFDFSIGKKL